MKERYVVGIDLGGTKILTAITDFKGNILAKVKKDTEAKKGKEVIVQNIKDTVYNVIDQIDGDLEEVKGIGLGSPGPLNIEEGIIQDPPNLKLGNVNMIKELTELKTPVFLENDANAAALGEKWFGAGKGVDDLIYITISTGIGGGIIINQEIVHGVSTGAGEIGHTTLDPNSNLQCGCGNYGCFEVLASGTALGRMGREAVEADKETLISNLVDDIEEINGAVVAEAATKGDQVAQDIIDKLANYLGIGIANLINTFNPEKVVVGGGVSQSWNLIEAKIENTVKTRALSDLVDKVKVVPAQLGSEVGVKGAIAVALVELDLLH